MITSMYHCNKRLCIPCMHTSIDKLEMNTEMTKEMMRKKDIEITTLRNENAKLETLKQSSNTFYKFWKHKLY